MYVAPSTKWSAYACICNAAEPIKAKLQAWPVREELDLLRVIFTNL